jgi:drug/metabolite transporter (DMT)-like permease
MTLLLGLLTAFDFGTADFLGGTAARRSPSGAVVASAQVASMLAALVLLLVFWTGPPDRSVFVIGAIAGATNMLALGALFHGLAMGRMAVVAPISAVVGASIPVVWGLAFGERPGALALVGVVCALAAAGLLGRGAEAEPLDHRHHSRFEELAVSVGAGVGFGTTFLLFAETTESSGYWPAFASRVSGSGLAVLGLALLRRQILPHREDRAAAAGSGLLDATGLGLLLLATRSGLRSVVAPIASLYPASTVILARLVLDERITRHQLAGLAVAILGLILIAVG